MLSRITKLSVILAFFLLGVMLYEANFKDSSQAWKNHQKPQIAAYSSLEQDQEILKELERQTQFSTHKTLDPSFFVKPNIFNTIAR